MDRIYTAVIVGLGASVITDGFLAYSLWSRADQVLAVTATDRVMSVMLQSYSALVMAQILLLFASAVLAVGLIAVLLQLRGWERARQEAEEE